LEAGNAGEQPARYNPSGWRKSTWRQLQFVVAFFF